MRKRLSIIILFLIAIALITIVCIWINNFTPVVKNGAVLPDNLYESQYAISDIEYDNELKGVMISFEMKEALSEDICITVTDIAQFQAYLFNQPIYQYAHDDIYHRTLSIRLDADAINNSGRIEVLFAFNEWSGGVREFLTGRPLMPAKFLIGTLDKAHYNATVCFGITMISFGVHWFIILISFIIFFRKPEEKYFFLLACVAVISMIAVLFTPNIPLVPITLKAYQKLRPILSIAPVMSNSAICFYLLSDCIPLIFRRWLTLKNLWIATVVLILVRILGNYSFYTFARFLLLLPIAWTLANAYVLRRQEFYFLFIGYACGEAIVLSIFIVNTLPTIFAGLPIVYMQINQLSYFFILLFSMMAVSWKIADKFKEAEKLSWELQQINSHLDTIVLERTQELCEQQEQKHAMMLNVFHDLRSPLFILREYLNELSPNNQEDEERIKTMRKRLQYASKLTEDLFLIAKLESGELLFDFNTIDLNELLETQARDNTLCALKKGIVFSYDGEPGCMVWGDTQRLQRAFQNILDNAFQNTPNGGCVIMALKKNEAGFQVSIQDTGKGIPKEYINKIFQRYYQAHKSIQNESSGLGLSISRAIIFEHHGSITARSALGKGSTFLITLPFLPDS